MLIADTVSEGLRISSSRVRFGSNFSLSPPDTESHQTGAHRCLPIAPRGARAAGRPGWLHTPAEARIRPRSARRGYGTGERHMGRPAFTWRRRCTSLGPLCHAPRLRRCSSREAALFVAAQPPPSSETRVRRARAAHHAMHVPAVATRSGASHSLLDDGARRASALRLAPRRRTAVLSTATGRFAGAAW